MLEESQCKGQAPPNGVQMLPVLQVIRLGLGDALAAANLSLEKVDNENQGLFLTSLVSFCVRPTICTSAIYTKGCSFGIWGMWCADCCLNSALQNSHTRPGANLTSGTPWEPVQGSGETGSSACARAVWEGMRPEFGPVVPKIAVEGGKNSMAAF